MLKVEVPSTKAKIKQQIYALTMLMEGDSTKDKEIHRQAIKDLRKALEGFK